MPREQRREIIQALERLRRSRVICCVTADRLNATGVIAKDFIPIFYNHLRTFGQIERLDIFLFTSGGDTLAGFGLSRLLRESASYVGALISEKCHSAGTLLILGANEIFMTSAATLSPIDPSVITPLNPKAEAQPGVLAPFPVSVENIAGFKDLMQEEWKLNPTGKSAAFGILSQHVHPLVLGQAYRTRQQIERLARVLLSSHRKDTRNIQGIVEHLTRRLGSHDYLISRKEAMDTLGDQVVSPNAELEGPVWALYEDFREEMELGRIFDPVAVLQQTVSRGGAVPVNIMNRLVIIESSAGSDVWESEMQVSPAPPPGPQVIPLTIGIPIQQVILYNGWRHYNP